LASTNKGKEEGRGKKKKKGKKKKHVMVFSVHTEDAGKSYQEKKEAPMGFNDTLC